MSRGEACAGAAGRICSHFVLVSGGRVDPLVILLFVAALVIGGALGWFAASRQAAKRGDEFRQAVKELGEAQIANATLKANADNFDKQLELMRQAREDLVAQFKAAGGEVLSKAQEEFLKTAAERFGHAEQANKEAVRSLLDPVHQRLKAYEEHVNAREVNRG